MWIRVGPRHATACLSLPLYHATPGEVHDLARRVRPDGSGTLVFLGRRPAYPRRGVLRDLGPTGQNHRDAVLKLRPSSFAIYDASGALVARGEVDPQQGEVEWRCEARAAGTYVIVMRDQDGRALASASVVVQR